MAQIQEPCAFVFVMEESLLEEMVVAVVAVGVGVGVAEPGVAVLMVEAQEVVGMTV